MHSIRLYHVFLFIFICKLTLVAQYKISGMIPVDNKPKTVFLSILGFKEESSIFHEQIIFKTQTDENGRFEFSGTLLSEENKFYRIHANKDGNSSSLQLFSGNDFNNYKNFIFSNKDTLEFYLSKNDWFGNYKNTNQSDKALNDAYTYERTLINEIFSTQQTEAKKEARRKYLSTFKAYITKNLNDPLLKLLCYAHLRQIASELFKEDYLTHTTFYTDILSGLEKNYKTTKYFYQYKEELSNLSSAQILENYQNETVKTTYFIYCILILIIALLVYIIKYQRLKKQVMNSELETLSKQEKKVTKLIIDGLSNKEIASDLFISPSTVKTHIRNLYSKLNVSNRTEFIEKMKTQPPD